ncbi:sensor histidine kinase [Actinomadura rupiterrae]|uniref:sensor histidine kinase n=1 Tax=Actinomadura rupiterrae TaxID=559627 RepID=UPI0020A4E41A|nr:HAMP domain-containing sensor histidine kinase [Actinomadura rupiterrae]MCP2342429.1 signal transduction histidine kinase [Actinomadura rupiterrae]
MRGSRDPARPPLGATRRRLLALTVPVTAVLAIAAALTLGLLSPNPALGTALGLLGALAVVALVAYATVRICGRALRPVAAMRNALAAADEVDLTARLRVPATGDEIEALGRAANAWADQVQRVVERERRFVADASHDLRGPITGLVTRLEDAAAEDPAPVLRALLADALRLGEIVDDLLELTRLDAGAEATVNSVDLSRLVAEEVARVPAGLAVTTDLAPGAVVLASRIRLARVLGNLLANAARHARNVHVSVTVRPPHAFLEVVDDGPGIDPAEAERVFERFVRLDDARRRDPGGSGLGLPIARQIARRYGGDLYAADHKGGAHFVLTLPLAD